MMIDRSLSRLENSILKTEQLLTDMIRNKEIVVLHPPVNNHCHDDNSDDDYDNATEGTAEDTQEESATINNKNHSKSVSKPSLSKFLTMHQSQKKKRQQNKKKHMVVAVADHDNHTSGDDASTISAISEPGQFVALPGGEDGCTSFLQHEEKGFPVFQHSLIVDRTWKQLQVQQQAGYDKKAALGKRILLCILDLMDMDDSLTTKQGMMKIASSFLLEEDTSSLCAQRRFHDLSIMLVDTVDVMVSLMGPDIDEFQDELQTLGQQCMSQGIPIHLLGAAVGEAIKHARATTRQQQMTRRRGAAAGAEMDHHHHHGIGECHHDDNNDEEEQEDIQTSWRIVIDFVASKMAPPSHDLKERQEQQRQQ